MATRGAAGIAGRRVRDLRRRKSLTAEDLAELIPDAAITKTVITNLESGRKKDLSAMELFQVASALQISPIQLMVAADSPLAPINITGLAKPYDGMCLAEYFVAINQDSEMLDVRLSRAMRLFSSLRSLERSLYEHETISSLTPEQEEVFDDPEAAVGLSDGQWSVVIRQHDLAASSTKTRTFNLLSSADYLVQTLNHSSGSIGDAAWLARRINAALDRARLIEAADQGEESQLPALRYIDGVGYILRPFWGDDGAPTDSAE